MRIKFVQKVRLWLWFVFEIMAKANDSKWKRLKDIDPDYESNNTAIRIREEQDEVENVESIEKIIENQFDLELNFRQKQIEAIENRLFKAQKLIHLVRYALVTSYYDKKSLNGTDEPESSNDFNPSTIFEPQNRIHPAIKKLLTSHADPLQVLSLSSKRKTASRNLSSDDSQEAKSTARKIKRKKSNDVSAKAKDIKLVQNHSGESRRKSKHRILVGNISKYTPSSVDDSLTHKWMVYIRGEKDSPDISGFVQKVVFHLHSSYKPHDVVEITESPFHLARRGWGEFPMRVQIVFKDPINKPVTIVHNLKLDKRYTGRQILGNETVVDLFLHTTGDIQEKENVNETGPDPGIDSYFELENGRLSPLSSKIQDELLEASGLAALTRAVNLDHKYALSQELENSNNDKSVKSELIQDTSNPLIYGLDERYSDQSKKPICILPKNFNLLNSKSVVFKVLPNETYLQTQPRLTNSISNENIDYNKYMVHFDNNRYRNMGEILPFLFKKVPLVSSSASDINYKCTYSFTAKDWEEFTSWHYEKRFSAEWSRAKKIRNILKTYNFFESNNWTTKALLMYGRSHGYVPMTNYKLFKNPSKEKDLLLSCFEHSDPNFRIPVIEKEDTRFLVDVEDKDNDPKSEEISSYVTDKTESECSYVRQCALDCGIVLKSEEIEEGVRFNGAERMILEAVKCLADGLIRRAQNYVVCNTSEENSIGPEEILKALKERKEMHILLDSNLF